MFYLPKGGEDPVEIDVEKLLRGVAFGKYLTTDLITNSKNEWVSIKESQFFERTEDKDLQTQAALQLLAYHEDQKRGQVDSIAEIHEELRRLHWKFVGYLVMFFLCFGGLLFK